MSFLSNAVIALKKALYYVEDSPTLVILIYGGITAGLYYFLHRPCGHYLASLTLETRQSILSASASSATALLGFVIAASTILMTLRFEGVQVRKIAQDRKLTTIYRTFISTILMLALCTVLTFGCLFVSQSDAKAYQWTLQLLLACAGATSLRILTTIFLLQDIGLIHLRQIENESQPPEKEEKAHVPFKLKEKKVAESGPAEGYKQAQKTAETEPARKPKDGAKSKQPKK